MKLLQITEWNYAEVLRHTPLQRCVKNGERRELASEGILRDDFLNSTFQRNEFRNALQLRPHSTKF